MVKNIEAIADIIENEFGVDYYSYKSHNPSYSIIEFAGYDIMIKNDISPQEFRAKTAEAFLDRVHHLQKVAQNKLERAENEVKALNKIYENYYDTVVDISDGKIETLEPINWKSHEDFLNDQLPF